MRVSCQTEELPYMRGHRRSRPLSDLADLRLINLDTSS